MKYPYLTFLLFISLCCFSSCEKHILIVNKEKEFVQMGYTANTPMAGSWRVTLKPGGVADILPGGDIVYRGAYKINGSHIKIKAEQSFATFNFDIISATDIKENEFGTVLRLKKK